MANSSAPRSRGELTCSDPTESSVCGTSVQTCKTSAGSTGGGSCDEASTSTTSPNSGTNGPGSSDGSGCGSGLVAVSEGTAPGTLASATSAADVESGCSAPTSGRGAAFSIRTYFPGATCTQAEVVAGGDGSAARAEPRAPDRRRRAGAGAPCSSRWLGGGGSTSTGALGAPRLGVSPSAVVTESRSE